jgi:hypothetical protein
MIVAVVVSALRRSSVVPNESITVVRGESRRPLSTNRSSLPDPLTVVTR